MRHYLKHLDVKVFNAVEFPVEQKGIRFHIPDGYTVLEDVRYPFFGYIIRKEEATNFVYYMGRGHCYMTKLNYLPVQEENGRRWTIMSVELTPYGYSFSRCGIKVK